MKKNLLLTLSLGLTMLFGTSAQTLKQAVAGKQNPAGITRKLATQQVKPFSLAARLQPATTRPAHMLYYQWDAANSAWVHVSIIDNTYDAGGNNIEMVVTDAATNQNAERYTDTYTPQNQLTESKMQLWNGSAWENHQRDTYTYDAQGNVLLEMSEEWMSGQWMPTSGTRHTYTYNAASHMTQHITEDWDNGSWLKLNKTIMVPSATGAWTEATEQEWNGSAWENTDHMYNAVWHNFGQFQLAGFINQEWKGNQWVDAVKYSATYTPSNSSIALYQLRDSLTGNWVDAMQLTQTYDAQGNDLGYKMEMWDGSSWMLFLHEEHLLTYNTNQYVTEEITRVADFNNPVYTNVERFVITSFVTLATAAPLSVQAPAAFPNPTASSLQISAGEENGQLKSIQLFDLTGRVVYSRSLSAGTTPVMVDIQHLPAGMYLLRTETSQGIADQKITKL